MAIDKLQIKEYVDQHIKENHKQEITGPVLNSTLDIVIDNLQGINDTSLLTNDKTVPGAINSLFKDMGAVAQLLDKLNVKVV